MRIQLKLQPREEGKEIHVDKGISLEEIYKTYEKELPYKVLAAKVDNKVESLTFKPMEDCNVEFLDMRQQAANLIYQDSLSFIYLKAVNDVLGNVDVEIKNSLNKGLFTEIKHQEELSEKDVEAIEMRMRQLVAENIAFQKEGDSYVLDGYKDFFYGLLVPSTGYIQYFELMKYHMGVLLRFPHPSDPNKIPDYVDEKMLYKTFDEQTRWGKLMKIDYVTDLNRLIDKGEHKELIQLSEALHERRIVEIADMITEQKKRIVLIAGPSSSGKTTFAQRLCIQLRVNGLEPLYMGTDDYFVERDQTPIDQYGEKNYEDLDAVDIGLFNSNMNDLLEGKTVDLPTFDFLKGSKIYGKRETAIKSNQPIVIEGIHALNEGLTPKISKEEKFKIYISPLTQLNIDSHNRIVTTDHRMLRRMVRDYKYRGYSAKNTIASWPKVRAGEDKNIFPFSNEADVLFNSVHLYEISVLKKYAEPLLQEIGPDEPEYGEAVRMLNFLKFFRTIEDDSIIVNNSIIREFIGGSIFVE